MSLLVWLPLNGNLNNYGLSQAQFSMVNNSGTLSSATSGGKVTQGYYKKTAANGVDYITSDINFTLDNDLSMCCWCKVTGHSTIDSANGIITQHGHQTGGLGITMHYVSANDMRMSMNTGSRGDSMGGADRTYTTYYGKTNIYNAWHHLCITYKKSTQKLQMYVDGKPEAVVGYGDYLTLPNNSTARPFRLFDWSTDYSTSSSYKIPCELNDVRLYDHCLSLKEVKEIA
jgi:hypothetical protein